MPWNGPFLMGYQKVNAILAAGNTVVIKPPTWGVLSMLLMAGVYEEAGFPAGVVNVVTGSGPEVGNYLVESDLVDMVSMTGGTATGREIITHSAKLVKDIALELGGKSPNIFFEDVDIEQAAPVLPYTALPTTRARSAFPAPGCWCSAAFTSGSWRPWWPLRAGWCLAMGLTPTRI